jgi:hypothetical protein
MDKIKVKVTPRMARSGGGSQEASLNTPSLYLNIDDILVTSYVPELISMEGFDFPPGEDPADLFVNVLTPVIWTKSQFYSGATQNLGAREGLKLNLKNSIAEGGNPMTSNTSPLWDYNGSSEEDIDNRVTPAYGVYTNLNEAVLSNPGVGVNPVANLWIESAERLEIERC